jgi:hypothetical protein
MQPLSTDNSQERVTVVKQRKPVKPRQTLTTGKGDDQKRKTVRNPQDIVSLSRSNESSAGVAESDKRPSVAVSHEEMIALFDTFAGKGSFSITA